MLDMDVRPPLFTGEEIESEPANTQNCRTHPYRIADPSPLRSTGLEAPRAITPPGV
jgi:hypothetical protein